MQVIEGWEWLLGRSGSLSTGQKAEGTRRLQLELQSFDIHLHATERFGAGSTCLTRLGDGDAGRDGGSRSTAGV